MATGPKGWRCSMGWCGGSTAEVQAAAQSMRLSPSIRMNSRTLWLTNVAPRARVWQAIQRSLAPIGVLFQCGHEVGIEAGQHFDQGLAALGRAGMDEEITHFSASRTAAPRNEKGMRRNTLIFFTTDNGGLRTMKVHAPGGKAAMDPPASNGPFRDGKASLYEGGVRLPAFVNWPARLRPRLVNEPLHHVDIMQAWAQQYGRADLGGVTPFASQGESGTGTHWAFTPRWAAAATRVWSALTISNPQRWATARCSPSPPRRSRSSRCTSQPQARSKSAPQGPTRESRSRRNAPSSPWMRATRPAPSWWRRLRSAVADVKQRHQHTGNSG